MRCRKLLNKRRSVETLKLFGMKVVLVSLNADVGHFRCDAVQALLGARCASVMLAAWTA